jgi:mRNA-degrading endonuclease RelE of RelBE toxin-antitoxin system
MPKFKPLFTNNFSHAYSKLDKSIKERLDKFIKKILEKPESGKPLRYELSGLRSEHVGKFRVLYEIRDNVINCNYSKH